MRWKRSACEIFICAAGTIAYMAPGASASRQTVFIAMPMSSLCCCWFQQLHAIGMTARGAENYRKSC